MVANFTCDYSLDYHAMLPNSSNLFTNCFMVLLLSVQNIFGSMKIACFAVSGMRIVLGLNEKLTAVSCS